MEENTMQKLTDALADTPIPMLPTVITFTFVTIPGVIQLHTNLTGISAGRVTFQMIPSGLTPVRGTLSGTARWDDPRVILEASLAIGPVAPVSSIRVVIDTDFSASSATATVSYQLGTSPAERAKWQIASWRNQG